MDEYSLNFNLRGSRVTCERPSDEGVSVPVAHLVLGFEVADDRHVLLESTVADDLLPLGDRATVPPWDRAVVALASMMLNPVSWRKR